MSFRERLKVYFQLAQADDSDEAFVKGLFTLAYHAIKEGMSVDEAWAALLQVKQELGVP